MAWEQNLWLTKTKKILFVDDDESTRIAIEDVLSVHFNYSSAGDGVQALVRMEQEMPGILITDNNMPNMTGLELIKVVRSNEAYKNVRIIMTSANHNLRDTALKAGADDFILKLYSPKDLTRAIDQLPGGPGSLS